MSADEETGVIPVAVRFEGHVGGRVVEVAANGTEYIWAEVIAWDPPNRFELSWHPTLNPVAASILEVRFTPNGSGTDLYLEHRGWEEFGQRGLEIRGEYDPGWDFVLDALDRATG